MFEEIFKNKSVNLDKLTACGFKKMGDKYVLSCEIDQNQFRLEVIVDEKERVVTHLWDNDTGDEYTLHLSEAVSGAYVGQIRQEVEAVLCRVADTCFDNCIFKNSCTQNLICYIKEKYGCELEFLWDKYPNFAVWRRKDNQKWFGIIMALTKDKFGLHNGDYIEVINLRMQPEKLEEIVDNQRYFKAYHMNKKYWVSVFLDASVPFDELTKRVDESYKLVGPKRMKKE